MPVVSFNTTEPAINNNRVVTTSAFVERLILSRIFCNKLIKSVSNRKFSMQIVSHNFYRSDSDFGSLLLVNDSSDLQALIKSLRSL